MLNGALVERTAYVIHRAEVVRAVDIRRARFRGNHDDGYGFNPTLFVHDCEHLEPVHRRHNYIEKHERDIGLLLYQYGYRLFAVFRLDNVEIVLQHIDEQRAI